MRFSFVLLFSLSFLVISSVAFENPYCEAHFEQDQRLLDEMKNFGTLEQVHVLIRHGDRAPCNVLDTPDKVLWNCKASSMSFVANPNETTPEQVDRLYRKKYLQNMEVLPGNCGLGELTDKGRRQHVRLGSYFRKIYVDFYGFMSPTFNPDEVFIRSTDVFRTIQSAEANFLGFYPKMNKGLVDINTVDRSTDYLTPNSRNCRRLRHLLRQTYGEKMWRRHFQKVSPLMNRLHKLLNMDSRRHLGIGAVFDHLNARQCHNLPWPRGFTEKDLLQVNQETIWHTKTSLASKELNRLSIGKLLQEWVTQMEEKVEGKKFPKWYLYSGHDSSVFPVLTALGIWDGKWPPYASSVITELWSQKCGQDECQTADKNYFVRVIYNGKAVIVPGCERVICPFDEYKRAIGDVLLTDRATQCEAASETRTQYEKRGFPTKVNSYHGFLEDFFKKGADFS